MKQQFDKTATKLMTDLIHTKCAWTTPVLGVEGKLLYFEPILKGIAEKTHELAVFTGEYKGSAPNIDINIIISGKFIRLYKNERTARQITDNYVSGFSISSPKIFMDLCAYKPNLTIINEFSVFSLYAAASKVVTKSKVLCIVEARPSFASTGIKHHLRTFLRKLICKLCDSFLTNNVDGEKYLTDMLGIEKAKITTRPYLVSIPPRTTAKKKQRQTKEKMKHFLYVGQLIKRKGLHFAIESINNLPPNIKENVIFDIVGDGPYRSQLEDLATSYNLDQTIRFHGNIKYDSLHNFYSSADAFIFPTLGDYRALTPFEALSYGLPIFSSIHDGGVSENVEHGKNGFRFDPRKPNQLREYLELFLSNKEMYKSFSQRSFELSKIYTLDSAIDAITTACIKTLSRQHRT